jgi:hypothetical protein
MNQAPLKIGGRNETGGPDTSPVCHNLKQC